MAKKYTFTQHPLEGIAHNEAAARQLQRMRKVFKRGELVPESVWAQANTMLAEKSRAMSFDSRRPYVVCQHEILHREPWLTLGIGPYLRDKEFSGINFVEEDVKDDNET